MGPRVLGVIPARMESRRLPGKPLREICGRPMLAWVYQNARAAGCLDHLLIATDSQEIQSFCHREGMPVVMTSSEHRSGTDRMAEVAGRERADIYVNIQGDEPMIAPVHLKGLLQPFQDNPSTQVTTLKVAIDARMAEDPNVTKVVTDLRGRALYFSHLPIPANRDRRAPSPHYKHLGVYGLTGAALEQFHLLPPSPLESLEQLEQLRYLEHGIPVTVVETQDDTIGVDTEEDLARVEAHFRSVGLKPVP